MARCSCRFDFLRQRFGRARPFHRFDGSLDQAIGALREQAESHFGTLVLHPVETGVVAEV
jgi:hypothetical protein